MTEQERERDVVIIIFCFIPLEICKKKKIPSCGKTCDSSSWEAEAGGLAFEAGMGFFKILPSKNNK
jgi:hypothetical protein